MYRPNRIGPWMLGQTEVPPVGVGGGTLGGAAAALPICGSHVTSGIANRATKGDTTQVTTALTLAAGEGVALGGIIAGDELVDDGEYIISCAGQWTGIVEDDMAVHAVLGRRNSGAGIDQDLDTYVIIPDMSVHSQDVGNNEHYWSVGINTSVISGEWRNLSKVQSLDDFFFGFWIVNYGADPGVGRDIIQSWSVHRYEFDLNPFDPNR